MGRGRSKVNKGEGYSQSTLKKAYDSVEVMWDLSPQEKYNLANQFTKTVANKNNFFENSVGFWDKKSRKPAGEPDHISYNRRTGKVSSKYWYTDKGVYRQSDHWGSDVASCSWYIKGRRYKNEGVSVGNKETAFIKWEDLKAKGLIAKDHKTGIYIKRGFKFEK